VLSVIHGEEWLSEYSKEQESWGTMQGAHRGNKGLNAWNASHPLKFATSRFLDAASACSARDWPSAARLNLAEEQFVWPGIEER
jgi:hypothetical protein